jgi:DNA topoisomerase-1
MDEMVNKMSVSTNSTNEVSDEERIRKLKIPKTWTNVKISPNYEDYLQVTGIDPSGKTQYIYHPLFVSLTEHEKYFRLKSFCKKFPKLEARIKNTKKSDHKNYMIGLMFRIMFKTCARIGNECYTEGSNATYGISTLEKKHVKINGKEITFNFIGKSGVRHNIHIVSKSIAKDLQALLKNTSKRLFEYDSVDMNNYIKETMSNEFSCKDFRTYISNKLFVEQLILRAASSSNPKKVVREVYKYVAEKLGHSSAISKSSYVMPIIPEKFIIDPSWFIGKDAIKIIIEI